MAVALQALLDIGENGEEFASLILVDKRCVQKVTPFGQRVDLLLDLVLNHGLTCVDRYAEFDPATQVPAAGWELQGDDSGVTTIRYPGPGGQLSRAFLESTHRWRAAAAAHGAVNVLVVGGTEYARNPSVGSNVLAELDVAAQRGLLATGVIAYAPPNSQDSTASTWRKWPLHGVTITKEAGRFTLNISSVEKGLISSMPLNPDEVRPLAQALSRAVATSHEPVNVSAIVRAVTGRTTPPPTR